MYSPEEITFNEQYTQWNKYNSFANLPENMILQKKPKRAYLFLLLGIVLIAVAIFLFTAEFKPSDAVIVLIALLAFMSLAAGIFSLVQKQKIILEQKSILIKSDRIEWNEIESISKYSFQALGGINFKNIILETKDHRKFEFTYNFLNHNATDIEQIIYMFWKRATTKESNG